MGIGFDSDCIQFPIILDRSEFSVFFHNKEEGRGEQRFGRSDSSSFEIFLKELIEFFLFA